MGENTAITWAHHTFNPWWGCFKISPGCTNCYAAAFDKRVGGDHWKALGDRRFFGDDHWSKPLRWDAAAARAGERHRVFCASMADVFEDRGDLVEHRTRLWRMINETPHLDWLLLTKRPENFLSFLPWTADGRPWSNVWLGVTAEDQEHADQRIPLLLRVPAAIRFVSYEPALGPLNLVDYVYGPTACRACGSTSTHYDPNPHNLPYLQNADGSDYKCALGVPQTGEPGAIRCSMCGSLDVDELPTIDWVILGDESGPRRRPADVNWFRDVIALCRDAGVAVHLKQWAGEPVDGIGGKRDGGKIHLPTLDGLQHATFPEVR